MRLRSKRVQFLAALALAAAIALGAAFAWSSFIQQRINVFATTVVPGVNLHDDFEAGPNKDVYVENSGDTRAFVRVRLTEYLETIERGSLIQGHERGDESTEVDYARMTWHPHNVLGGDALDALRPGDSTGEAWPDDANFHDYYRWTMGGQKYYLPAVEQLGVDENGESLAFADDPEVLSDLTEYDGSEENVRQTLWADVISMEMWATGGYTYFDGTANVTVPSGEKAMGNFWIVDADGWCYWAQPLEAHTATGLLLNSVERTENKFDSTAEYAINVWLQAADEMDIGMFDVPQNGGMTDDAGLLARIVTGRVIYTEDGLYENNNDGTYTRTADTDGQPIADAKPFVPLGSYASVTEKLAAPEDNRLYIGDKFSISPLVWDGDDYTNYSDMNAMPSPWYNVTKNENGEYTVLGAEICADGNIYLAVSSDAGKAVYLASVLAVEAETASPTDSVIMPMALDPTDDTPYRQGYPGTGPFGFIYTSQKPGRADDLRYDPDAWERRLFHHIGNGVYVEVENEDDAESKDDPVTYYFAGKILGGTESGEAPYVIDSLKFPNMEEAVDGTFPLQLTVGDGFDVVLDENGAIDKIVSGGTQYEMEELSSDGDGNLQLSLGEDGYIGTGEGGVLGGGMTGDPELDGEYEQNNPGGGGGVILLPMPTGTGTLEDPFAIRRRRDMNWVSSQVLSGHDFAGEYLVVENDFDMGGEPFTPIGVNTAGHQFMGTFDGAEFTISGLVVQGASDYRGLFGYTGAGSAVKNVKLDAITVSGNGSVGGVVGYNSGTIENCHVLGGAVSGANQHIGGIVGNNAGTLIGCTNGGTVTGTGTGNERNAYIGGIAGSTSGNIEECDNLAAGVVTASKFYVGGIVGYINTPGVKISDCENTGMISGSSYAGGIVAQTVTGATVEACVNTGDVVGYGTVGGVVGNNLAGATVRSSRNEGTLLRGNLGDTIGGIAGANAGTVEDCENTGLIDTIRLMVGGVVGENAGTVQTSHSTGNVTVSGNNGGGVVGENIGTVQTSYNTGDIQAGVRAGGVAGWNDGLIANCYAWGDVTATTGAYAGGVAGIIRNNDAGTPAEIRYSYHAGGAVSAATQRVGGIVGGREGGSVGNSAGLAVSVSGTSMVNKAIGDGTGTNLYANQGMTVTGTVSGTAGTELPLATMQTTGFWANTVGGDFGGGAVWAWDDAEDLPVLAWQDDSLPVLVESTDPGTAKNPFQITSRADLEALSAEVNAGDAKVGVYYQVVNDIDMTATAFTPIGSNANPFGGVFDGGNHTLSNLTLSGGAYRGLFGYTGGSAVIKNVNLAAVNISAGNRSGAIVGMNSSGTIENCHVQSGTISVGAYSGGIVGLIDGGVVSGCSNAAPITASGSGEQVGGIVGQTGGASVTIQNCVNNAAGVISASARNYVGGIVGYANATAALHITGCRNAAEVTGAGNVGGIAGASNYNDGILENCANTGSVTGNAANRVGGVAGSNNGTVRQCANQGATVQPSGSSDSLGGIVGYNTGAIADCYATNSIQGVVNLGGVAGYSSGTIENCYFTGGFVVFSTGAVNLGGIVGQYDGISVTGCAAFPTIIYTPMATNPPAIGRVIGVGSATGMSGNYYWNGTTLQNCSYTNATVGTPGGGVPYQTQPQTWWSDTVGFDFTSTWKWNTATGLPILAWQ